MPRLTPDQILILDNLVQWFYDGRDLPHVKVVQQYPGQPEELLTFVRVIEEFEHHYQRSARETKHNEICGENSSQTF